MRGDRTGLLSSRVPCARGPGWTRLGSRAGINSEEAPMAYLLAHFELDDYDAWKSGRFDQDPAGRAQSGAKRHQLFRAVEDGNQVFIGLEFASADEANAFRE